MDRHPKFHTTRDMLWWVSSPPFEPMLAAAAAGSPESMSGELAWEPKFDGWRALWHRTDDGCQMRSRQGHELTDCFPDVATAVCEQVPPGTVLDGELVVWRHGRIDFTALTERMTHRRRTHRRRCAQLAQAFPATFVVFDVLRHAGVDVRGQPLKHRRTLLEALSSNWCPPLQLTPQTTDVAVAKAWLTDYTQAGDLGIEGLVAKRVGERYRSGVRSWRKFRIRHTREAVVAGTLGPVAAPRALVLGLLDTNGDLRVAGVTMPLNVDHAAEIAALLEPASPEHPWQPDLRWSGFGGEPVRVTLADGFPVVEVSADTAFEQGRWRHPTRFLRHRADLRLTDLPTVTGPRSAA